MKHIKATLLGQRKLVGRLSVQANVSNTSQTNLAFVCAEDDLDVIEAEVKELERQFKAPCHIPSITEKARR